VQLERADDRLVVVPGHDRALAIAGQAGVEQKAATGDGCSVIGQLDGRQRASRDRRRSICLRIRVCGVR